MPIYNFLEARGVGRAAGPSAMQAGRVVSASTPLLLLLLAAVAAARGSTGAGWNVPALDPLPHSPLPETDWLSAAGHGVFTHFLNGLQSEFGRNSLVRIVRGGEHTTEGTRYCHSHELFIQTLYTSSLSYKKFLRN
jgi:hypothetical protein